MDAIWPQSSSRAAHLDVPDVHAAETLIARIQELAPQNDDQRYLRTRALSLGEDLLEARWLASSTGSTVLAPFLTALLFWLSITFASFGLYAPRNATVIVTLLLCALSVAGAVFLVLEMDGPFEGVVKISPQRAALRARADEPIATAPPGSALLAASSPGRHLVPRHPEPICDEIDPLDEARRLAWDLRE